MGWYKEYLQDAASIRKAADADYAKGCGCVMAFFIPAIIAIAIVIYVQMTKNFFESPEEEKIAYALGVYMADPNQAPMKSAISAFKKATGGESPNMQNFGNGFHAGLNEFHLPIRTDFLTDSHKYYNKQKKLKKKKINEWHNGIVSTEYGYCYGAVIKNNFNQKLKAFKLGARDHHSFPEPRHKWENIKLPMDSVSAILARHKEFVNHITKSVQKQCKLF